MRRAPVVALLAALAAPAAAAPSCGRLCEEARQALRGLVRLDTSNPPGNEALAAEYLKQALAREKIDSDVLASSPGRASLVARLRGSGAKRPLLLMCHTDVVPADRAQWSVDPFAAAEKDGFLYGRGTLDVKSMCAAELAILLELKRSGAALSRDVVFFAEAGEEGNEPERNIDWLLREHPDKVLDAEFAINEGGEAVWKDGAMAEVRVQMAEKEYLDVHVKARGASGHSSVPRPDNALVHLSRAVARLAEHRFPARILPPVRGFLEDLAARGGAQAKLMRAVLDARPGPDLDRAADALAALDPEYGAMLRDTLVPTILQGGYKSNVIPAQAEAVLNARLLPGREPAAFAAELREVLAGLPVEVSLDVVPVRPAGAMPVDTELFAAVKESVAELYPKARVTPYMAAWSTDSIYLRGRGIVAYGVDPPWIEGDESRPHGTDERIVLGAFDAYTRYLDGAVRRLALAR